MRNLSGIEISLTTGRLFRVGADYLDSYVAALTFSLLIEKTKIYGKIAFELNCAPVHAEEQRHLLQAQTSEAARSGKLQILDRRNGQILLTGTGRAADWDSNFIVRFLYSFLDLYNF